MHFLYSAFPWRSDLKAHYKLLTLADLFDPSPAQPSGDHILTYTRQCGPGNQISRSQTCNCRRALFFYPDSCEIVCSTVCRTYFNSKSCVAFNKYVRQTVFTENPD